MMLSIRSISATSAIAIAILTASPASAFNSHSAAFAGKSIAINGQTVPVAECALTGPGFVVCAGIAIALHELQQALNGKKAFGPNGEVIKAINTIANDLKNGPGEHNDLVGRKGWLRSRLGF